MLCYNSQLRFTRDELATLRKLCGDAYVEEPRTVAQYNKMVSAAQAARLADGELSRARALEAMLFQSEPGEQRNPLRIVA
jgi:hypothetical protein